MNVITWQMDENQLAQYMLTHIDRMAAKGQIDLKLATKLVADELGRLITMQSRQCGRLGADPTVASLEKVIRAAGGRSAEQPGKGG
jgi:hypothetical protein